MGARKFAEFVRNKMSAPKEQLGAAAARPAILGQIEKPVQLKAGGILSDDEFAEQETKLLGKL